MPNQPHLSLSRRERQIMEIVYARGEATATHVLEDMIDPPGRTSIRTFLRILEEKGYLTHRKVGREYMFKPTRTRKREGRSALRRVIDTFFEGSLDNAVAEHLADRNTKLSDDELARLAKLIQEARRKGR